MSNDPLDKAKLKSMDRLPVKTVAGYGAGDFAFNLAFSLSTSFLLYYYTDDEKFKQIRDETEARKLAAIEANHEKPVDFVTPDHAI